MNVLIKINSVIAFFAVFIVFLMFETVAVFSQENIKTVNDSAFTTRTRPQVTFAHDAHNGKAVIDECNVCHHWFEKGNPVDDDDSVGMECSECHYSKNQDAVSDLIRVYHLQCSGCHLKQKSGPIVCGECHLKE